MHTTQQLATRTGIAPQEGLVPSPMFLVRELTDTSEEANKHVLYFETKGVTGPGFGNDNPQILARAQPIHAALLEEMRGMVFFMSMIPLADLHGERKVAPVIPRELRIPLFRAAFEPLRQALVAKDLGFDRIDMEISVDTGGVRYGVLKRPTLVLSVIGRNSYEEPVRINVEKFWPGVSMSLDLESPDIRSILDWYCGAQHGCIILKVTRPRLTA